MNSVSNNKQTVCNSSNNRLLKIYCRHNKSFFLIDTGASVSVIPKNIIKNKHLEIDGYLRAVNNHKIPTYGSQTIKIDLGLRRTFSWDFIVSDVNMAILGLDFLRRFKLNVIPHENKLRDSETGLYTTGVLTNSCICSITNDTNDKRVKKLLNKYKKITEDFSQLDVVTHNHVHNIPTIGTPPCFRPRRLNPKMAEIAKTAFDNMLEKGIVRRSTSKYASPLHMVPKGQSWRIVGDYRALNKITAKDTYPLPFLQDFTNDLFNKKVFSKIDLKDAFHNIPINENDIPKTCVTTPFGAFEYLRMSFGLHAASQTFMRFIDSILRNLSVTDKNGNMRKVAIFAYIDDILIASDNEENHEQDLEALLKILNENNLHLSLHKCSFFQKEISFLGHLINDKGLTPLPEKVSAIANFPLPNTLGNVRRFLGLINFYHRFIKNCAEILQPLNQLMKGYKKSLRNKVVDWSQNTAAEKAFNTAKEILAQTTALHYPTRNGQISIHTDASDIAVGAVLQEFRDNSYVPLGFFSRKLEPREKLYSIFARELLAIYLAIKHFRHFLEGHTFKIYTDHSAITHAIKNPLERAHVKESRMLSFISQFDVEIIHIPGKNNEIADLLSRPNGELNMLTDTSNITRESLIIAQTNDADMLQFVNSNGTKTLKLEKIDGIYCENKNDMIRPYIPQSLRETCFKNMHNMSHCGVKSSQKLICQRFVWPDIKRYIKQKVQQCLICQKNKVLKHNKTPIMPIENYGPKFSSIHIDLVGPLPLSNGYTYLLTVIDRYSRYPDAIPLQDIRTESIINALMLSWIARHGVPDSISTDRGSQFTSREFSSIFEALGCKIIHTTAYNPRANGIIERFHRTLKVALRAGHESAWFKRLPLALLALRTTFKESIQTSPSLVVYGSALKLSCELLLRDRNTNNITAQIHADRLREFMSVLTPPKPITVSDSGYIDPNLLKCPYVFVKNNNKQGLQSHYKGPYKVLKRNDKFYTLQLSNKTDTVSIDRLKSAYLPEPKMETIATPTFIKKQPTIIQNRNVISNNPTNPPNTSRQNVSSNDQAKKQVKFSTKISPTFNPSTFIKQLPNRHNRGLPPKRFGT